MRKLNCYICDKCRKVLDQRTMVTVQGKERELHYCNETCRDEVKVGNVCPFCMDAILELCHGVEPWSDDHIACPNCDSTYCL